MFSFKILSTTPLSGENQLPGSIYYYLQFRQSSVELARFILRIKGTRNYQSATDLAQMSVAIHTESGCSQDFVFLFSAFSRFRKKCYCIMSLFTSHYVSIVQFITAWTDPLSGEDHATRVLNLSNCDLTRTSLYSTFK